MTSAEDLRIAAGLVEEADARLQAKAIRFLAEQLAQKVPEAKWIDLVSEYDDDGNQYVSAGGLYDATGGLLEDGMAETEDEIWLAVAYLRMMSAAAQGWLNDFCEVQENAPRYGRYVVRLQLSKVLAGSTQNIT